MPDFLPRTPAVPRATLTFTARCVCTEDVQSLLPFICSEAAIVPAINCGLARQQAVTTCIVPKQKCGSRAHEKSKVVARWLVSMRRSMSMHSRQGSSVHDRDSYNSCLLLSQKCLTMISTVPACFPIACSTTQAMTFPTGCHYCVSNTAVSADSVSPIIQEHHTPHKYVTRTITAARKWFWA